MLLLLLFIVILHQQVYVTALDLNSLRPRTICFKEKQKGCNENFIDVYKNLSKSVTNYTDAETFMLLYTRKNPDEPEKLHKCAGRLPPNSNFNPENRLLVSFMPFLGGYCNVAVYREWTKQLLKKEDLNILVIDYTWGNQADYASSVLNCQRIIRNQTVILLRNIQEQTGIHNSRIVFVGHSLGAQLAGMIGNEFKVARIIGIDPAGPGFEEDKTPLEDRLDRSDADLVEVWHSNAGNCMPNFGIGYDAGHVNFYFNDGTIQPACHKYSFISLLKGDIAYAFGTMFAPTACYHAHCAQYFKVSINPKKCQFVGVKCDNYLDFKLEKCRSCGSNGENCLVVGWNTDKYLKEIPSTPQKYYIDTTLNCPYCDNSKLHLDGYQETYKSVFRS